ncbi:flagellar assembly protein FliH [Halomonas vilamensis]|uniref:Flagellar assembly protein FliH n=1 Tax=Vreelandella vilamensis TaxID=531309 RepID=A0ABU1H5E5_9GAMM|nr:flagellar assembly protein FliH [Halomonas vilamensis]MDR5898738.1 flagellar assembly protein FliH [Halomonas vilamensis]
MSDFQSAEFDRHGHWRRWQMDELSQPTQRKSQSGEPASPATEHKRKVAAAKKAAEAARKREEQERQTLYDKVRRQAEEEGYQAGFERGQKEGRTRGLEEGRKQANKELEKQIKQTITPLTTLTQEFNEALALLDDTVAHDLVDLALATGKKLASDALDVSPEHILNTVRQLLHTEPPLVGQQRLWLNPDDHAIVEQHLGDELRAANWKLQPDDQLARGGCRVTSAQGELDATFESRWRSIQSQTRQRHTLTPSDHASSNNANAKE